MQGPPPQKPMLWVSGLGSRHRCALGTGRGGGRGRSLGPSQKIQTRSGSTQVPDARNSGPSCASKLRESLDKSILSLSLSLSWLEGSPLDSSALLL